MTRHSSTYWTSSLVRAYFLGILGAAASAIIGGLAWNYGLPADTIRAISMLIIYAIAGGLWAVVQFAGIMSGQTWESRQIADSWRTQVKRRMNFPAMMYFLIVQAGALFGAWYVLTARLPNEYILYGLPVGFVLSLILGSLIDMLRRRR